MSAPQSSTALPLRAHTIFGACEAIGEDFGFNPIFLRVPLATMVLWSPTIAIGSYLTLCAIVLASRLLFPSDRPRRPAETPAHTPANEQAEIAKAA